MNANINEQQKPKIKVLTIKDIPFDLLNVPEYQRPYKWTEKNVNQFINDLVTFQHDKQYRLGTLVIHKNGDSWDIVDGQQRMITLSLILKYLETQGSLIDDANKSFSERLNKFCGKRFLSNKTTLRNITNNFNVIQNHNSDLNDEMALFIEERCQFVVVVLTDISEAFQFFDSQNTRGKELAPHDLLKAFHLRAMTEKNIDDYESIDFWQRQHVDQLKYLFEDMFRAKLWSKGFWADEFTKNDIDVFKGVSIDEKKRYPFYQMEVMAHLFVEMYNADPSRRFDQQHVEFPFNLDDQVVNGRRFFDMAKHYLEIVGKIAHLKRDFSGLLRSDIAKQIIDVMESYPARNNRGDKRVRNLFNVTLLYYIDRFGYEMLDKIIPHIFLWCYSVRLKSRTIKLQTILNHALAGNSLIRLIHRVSQPKEILELCKLEKIDVRGRVENGEVIKPIVRNSNRLYELFISLNMTYYG